MGNDMLSPIRILFCGADVYMLYRFFSVIFQKKRKGKKLLLASLLLTIVMFFENGFCNTYMNVLIMPVLTFIYVMLIFQISISNAGVYVIIFYSFMSNKEFVFVLLHRLLAKNLPFYFPPWDTSGGIYYLVFTYLVCFIFLTYIEKYTKKLEIDKNNKFSFYLLIVPILSLLIARGFIYNDFPESTMMQVLICVASTLFWLTNAVIFIILERYTNLMNKIKYSELSAMKRKMEKEHLQNILRINEQYRCYMHDINGYFNSFRMLVLNGEGKKVVKILDELQGKIHEQTNVTLYSESPVLNAILSERIIKAKEKGIILSLFIEKFLKLDFISDVDMISMFGNLLDNALEAAEKCSPQNRKVNLKLFMGSNFFLVFHIKNSYAVAAKKEGTRLLSTKADSSHHGLGIGIVKSLAEKYGGTLNLEEKGDLFITTLTISKFTRENKFVS